MFAQTLLDVQERFSAIEEHFRASRKLKGRPAQISRGLSFIQLYAVHEYTVKNVVSEAARSIVAHGHSFGDLRPSLLALFLNSELQALRDCGKDTVWENRLQLLERAFSDEVVSVVGDPALPSDGSHFRSKQLQLIFRVFGINRLPARRRQHMHRIDEVVHNRNRIAHGNETPESVGQRYSRSDIRHRIKQMKSVCIGLVVVLSQYCVDAEIHLRI